MSRADESVRAPAPLLALMAWWGYLTGAQGCVAPFLARSFALDDAGTARLLAWTAVASLGSLLLGRRADRVGRRRLLLACAVALPPAALTAALAPAPWVYVVGLVASFALGGAILSTVGVVLAELLPAGARARGQGRAGLALAVATVVPLAVTALVSDLRDPWRIVWLLAALPAVALPWLYRALPETGPWRREAAGRRAGGVRLRELLAHPHRARVLTAFASLALIGAVEAATRVWLLYHPVRELGIPARQAAAVLLLGGTVGLLGFRVGARVADERGRLAAFRLAACVFALGAVGYYGPTPPAGLAGLAWLAAFLALLGAGGNAALTSFRVLAAELLPTRLRGSFGGLLAVANALGWGLAMGATSLAAPAAGGVGVVVAFGVALALPLAAALLSRLPETLELPLEGGGPPLGRAAGSHG